jgi:hypothetical protein
LSRPQYTSPIAPEPIRKKIAQGPNRVPAVRSMDFLRMIVSRWSAGDNSPSHQRSGVGKWRISLAPID